jgi:hypothetical protein
MAPSAWIFNCAKCQVALEVEQTLNHATLLELLERSHRKVPAMKSGL